MTFLNIFHNEKIFVQMLGICIFFNGIVEMAYENMKKIVGIFKIFY